MKMIMFDYRDSEGEFFKNNFPNDLEIEFIKTPLNEVTKLTDTQKEETVVISVFIESNLTESVLSQFKNLQVIATRSTGFNHINIDYCRNNNIAVINVPDYGKTSVAQYTIGIILTLTRNVLIAANDIKNRRLNYPQYEGRDLSHLTLGVIGTGSIGSAVCELAHKLNMKILAHDIKVNERIKDFVEYVPQDKLLEGSDIISLHIPYILEFYHMLSYKEFEKMKDGAYIINTSRGELIDTGALYHAIKIGKVKGAALDVLECEYLNFENENVTQVIKHASDICLENVIITDKLMQFDNIIITPHIAYNTKESVLNILTEMFISIKGYFHGERLNRVV